jgi:hypothetical protein
MVVRNKLYRIIDKYHGLLMNKYRKTGSKNTLKTNRIKNKILDFYLKNNRWPNRRSLNKNEKRLASKFENYISKENGCYDPSFRRIVMSTGRKSNNKRKHDRKALKREIIDFIVKYGHVPNRYNRPHEIEGESKLRGNLDRYTGEYGDMGFLGQVYSLDPCHRSGIPLKFRPLINKSLDVDKPLIRMVYK